MSPAWIKSTCVIFSAILAVATSNAQCVLPGGIGLSVDEASAIAAFNRVVVDASTCSSVSVATVSACQKRAAELNSLKQAAVGLKTADDFCASVGKDSSGKSLTADLKNVYVVHEDFWENLAKAIPASGKGNFVISQSLKTKSLALPDFPLSPTPPLPGPSNPSTVPAVTSTATEPNTPTPAAQNVATAPTAPTPVAPLVCRSPTPANASTLTQQSSAIASQNQLSLDQLNAPCTTASPVACSAISKDLADLVSKAAAASIALKGCAYGGAASADVNWYVARASLWDRVAVEKQNNADSFASGFYLLPVPLSSALSVPFNTVYAAPTITTQPTAITVNNGSTGTLIVVATGPAAITYQWFKNGAAIAGATSTTYITPPVASVDNGALFTVVVTNTGGSITSIPAKLTVNGADADTEAAKEADIAAQFQRLVLHSEEPCVATKNTACFSALKDEYTSFAKAVDDVEKIFPNIENDYSPTAKTPAPVVACSHASASDPANVTWIQGFDRLEVAIAEKPTPKFNTRLMNGQFAFCLPDVSQTVEHVRVLTGIDVSSASSADPAARFLLDASINIPVSTHTGTSSLNAKSWLWGDVRLSSIQSPGPVSGVAAPTTYLSGLTAQSPNSIVASFETTLGYGFRIYKFDNLQGRRPLILSFVVDGGIITPLSNTQASPPIYTVSAPLQAFYTQQAASSPSSINVQNMNAVNTACGITPPTPIPSTFPTCYFAQYPEARNRLFRNYAAGFRLQHYYYNGISHRFGFPAIFEATLGQNDYVTGGQLHRLVTHFGGSTPLSPIGAIQGLYVYAGLDLELTRSNISNQQFLFTAAPGTITTSSPNFAAVFVGQPDRDRYRFGIAYDLNTLYGLLTTKK